MVKNLPANAGDAGSIPGSGRSPGEGNGNPLQYSCLRNPMDGGAWQATVHRGHKRVRQGLESKRQQKRFYLPFNWFRVHSACHRSAAGCGKSSAAWLSLLSSAFCMVSPPSHHLVNAINQNPIAENACISPTHLLLWQQFRHLSRCQAISVEINSIVFTVTVLSVLDLIHGKI